MGQLSDNLPIALNRFPQAKYEYYLGFTVAAWVCILLWEVYDQFWWTVISFSYLFAGGLAPFDGPLFRFSYLFTGGLALFDGPLFRFIYLFTGGLAGLQADLSVQNNNLYS